MAENDNYNDDNSGEIDVQETDTGEDINPVLIEEEMKKSYIDYAMSVIVGRALPDARDGLKPVHRRILYSMKEAGITYDKPYKKSARVVGDVLGKFHPHGDMAVYDSLVRMVQEFSMRYPLIDGQGNFGSIDGDSAAAMRYTEVRMEKISEEMLVDIDKETVPFQPNYDGALTEPTVLPAKLPNLIVNGSTGIAVGMATNIPPHNLKEVADGLLMMIDNPDVSIPELRTAIKGPDFPTSGTILGTEGIKSAYETGRGRIKIRSVADIEEMKNDKHRIVVSELPYQVNKANLIESIASLVRDKKIQGISDLRDESDREGIRIVIELVRNTNPNVILNQLYKHTQLQVTYGIINLALVDGVPKVLNLYELLQIYLNHRMDVIQKRSQYQLRKAEERAHILDGLKICLGNLDEVISFIRNSKTTPEAKEGLIEKFQLDEAQAKAILDMRLQNLTAIEQDKIESEYNELVEKIADLKEIIASDSRKYSIIKDELTELKENYADERRTDIQASDDELSEEDLIPEEDVLITITNSGYIKRLPVTTYSKQHRGGRGVAGINVKDDDFVEDVFVASTRDYLLLFTNKGRVNCKKVYEIPQGSKQSRGKALVNLFELENDEAVSSMITVKEFSDDWNLLMATKYGTVKKTPLSSFKTRKKSGLIAINLTENDELVNVILTDGQNDIILVSSTGKAIRFAETNVRPMGRAAQGVRGIRLNPDDRIISMDTISDDENAKLLTITQNGYGKRTKFEEYRRMNRGGRGVTTIQMTPRNGPVVNVRTVRDDDDIVVTSYQGLVIRIPVKDIRVQGRNTQGVKIMNMRENDKVIGVARIKKDDDN